MQGFFLRRLFRSIAPSFASADIPGIGHIETNGPGDTQWKSVGDGRTYQLREPDDGSGAVLTVKTPRDMEVVAAVGPDQSTRTKFGIRLRHWR